jgi:predicted AAA+ superfamily ATPase
MDNIVNSIPEFDPIRDLPDHFLMIMYGMRRSGKTVMLKHMLEQLQDRLQYHEVYLFCGTIGKFFFEKLSKMF